MFCGHLQATDSAVSAAQTLSLCVAKQRSVETLGMMVHALQQNQIPRVIWAVLDWNMVWLSRLYYTADTLARHDHRPFAVFVILI